MAIPVTCAIIWKDGLILAAQRSESMSLPLKWEFPGGKLDEGESPEECILREIEEELCVRIQAFDRLPSVFFPEDQPHIELIPFHARILGGELHAVEHKALKWCLPEELPELDWAEADLGVIDLILTGLA